jgi:UDP-3-O-[3-hydroxymyristoyl] glucosamine N-acyltransferase
MKKSVAEIAKMVGGTILGDQETIVEGLNGLKEADSGELSFLGSPQYEIHMSSTAASAVFVSESYQNTHNGLVLIQVANPYMAFAQMLKVIEEETLVHPKGIHPSAVMEANVSLGQDVGLDAYVCIREGAVIEDGAVLYSGVHVGRGAHVGAGTVVYPNTTIRDYCVVGSRCIIHSNVAIGSDGFGFAPAGGVKAKISQIGIVRLGDDVEIGSNSAVDRATCGETLIEDGVKIDNLVQIGHNVRIGKHTTISGASAIAGSTTIGSNCTLGGQTGINGHIEIGDNVMVGGGSAVLQSVASNAVISGTPAIEHKQNLRCVTSMPRLPEALRRIRTLEKRLEELEKHLNG